MNEDSIDYLKEHGTLKQVQLAEKIRDQELKEEQFQKYLNQANISSNPISKCNFCYLLSLPPLSE